MAKFTFEGLSNGNPPEAGKITVYDDDHKPLVLGAEYQLGRTGASGSVYEIASAPEYCVKIFKPQELADRTRRNRLISSLEAMLKMPECMGDRRLCWPLGLVRDEKDMVVGYAMRRIPKDYVTFKSIFYGAKSVSRRFPAWGRRELAQTAKNFVDALIDLEARGVRPADFNAENMVCNERCEVKFIDCDSFMFYERNGTVHTSAMYCKESAPVEILRNPTVAAGEPRTVEQTCFSAAVLSFMLVMTGQHPYAHAGASLDGSYTESHEENILMGKCPLGRGAGCQQAPNWYAIWSWITGSLQSAFIATFRDGHEDPAARTPLERLSMELGKFAYECARTPERNELAPAHPKPREAHSANAYGPRTCGFAPRVPMQRPYVHRNGPQRNFGFRPYGTLPNNAYRSFGGNNY